MLLPLLAVTAWILISIERPRRLTADPAAASSTHTATDCAAADTSAAAELFAFDPNTADIYDLCRLGLSQSTAASIIKYRRRGKVFEIPEDFASCYGVSLDDYRRLEPYIVIAPEYRLRPSARGETARPHMEPGKSHANRLPAVGQFRIDTAGIRTLMAAGLSEVQARTLLNYRDKCGGLYTLDELRRCRILSGEAADWLSQRVIFPARPAAEAPAPGHTADSLTDINSATSEELVRLSGIGETTAARIVEYRRLLGGFHSAEQLAEINGITERNFERILRQIRVEDCEIRKIDINFAAPEEIGAHPYVTPLMLRRILKHRQLKGGWSRIEEMLDDNILTSSEAARLAPYLRFND